MLLLKHFRKFVLGLAVAALLLLYGCVELTGQRFTWFHDTLKDTFYVFIQYDGIHNSATGDKSEGQIAAFIKNQDIMILDWPFHLDRKAIGEMKIDENPAGFARVQKLAKRLETEVVGHYREPDGRVGAAQLVTIKGFKDFLEQCNQMINIFLNAVDQGEEIERAKKQGELWRTLRKIFAAAKAEHSWINAHGHALRVTVPVDREEWAEFKGDGLRELLKEALRDAATPKEQAVFERAARSLASMPLSYTEAGDKVTLTLGDPLVPRTIHVHIRDDYNDKLEPVVSKHVATDLDAALRQVLYQPGVTKTLGQIGSALEQDVQVSESLLRVRHWLPREVEIGALLAVTGKRSDPVRDQAIRKLHELGKAWNQNDGHPTAPTPKGSTQADYLAAWRDWYSRRRRLAGNPGW
jgi:hypothetical protein